MAMSIEQIIAILACARIGAIHSVVYGGFSASMSRLRIEDAKSQLLSVLLILNEKVEKIDLRTVVTEATKDLEFVDHVIMDQRDNSVTDLNSKEINFHEFETKQNHCALKLWILKILYLYFIISGTTGKPKGVLHTCGYNLYTHFTTKTTFDVRDNDVFWCTADPGWITGHSYIIYGPLSVGLTSVISEGAPDFPEPDQWWKIIERYRVNIFYTAPTAVRLFMKYGEQWPLKHDLGSLRVLGSVGEPIILKLGLVSQYIGSEKCAIVDTWWQKPRLGGHMITTFPSMKTKPGRAGVPLFGIDAGCSFKGW